MTPDHYATLGVAPSSEDSAIRAAYLELMRRYHPDKNASAQAAEQVRAITAAYQVLSDWHRRAEYDLQRARMRARGSAGTRPARPPPRPSALFGAGSVLVLLLVLVAIRPSLFAPEQPDRLPAERARQAVATKPDPATHCRTAEALDAIKHELFRRAAQLRGSDRAAFDRLARHAIVRIDSPELIDDNAALGTVDCAATVALDLPPGVAVLGGQRTLIAEVDYSVTASATGGGPIRLVNDGLIVAPLATLVPVRPSVAEPAMPAVMAERGDEPALPRIGEAPPPRLLPVPPTPLPRLSRAPPPLPARAAPQPIAPQRAARPRMASQPKPSFSCRIARGRGEIAVCKSSNLAKLDRHLGMLYGQSWGQADAARREQLLGTRDGFIARRDACRSDSCISAAYLSRMREISEIMAAK